MIKFNTAWIWPGPYISWNCGCWRDSADLVKDLPPWVIWSPKKEAMLNGGTSQAGRGRRLYSNLVYFIPMSRWSFFWCQPSCGVYVGHDFTRVGVILELFRKVGLESFLGSVFEHVWWYVGSRLGSMSIIVCRLVRQCRCRFWFDSVWVSGCRWGTRLMTWGVMFGVELGSWWRSREGSGPPHTPHRVLPRSGSVFRKTYWGRP